MRQEFSRKTKAEALERSGGCCCSCRIPLTPATGIEFDHRIPDAVNGANSVGNCEPLCMNCHGAKTSGDVKAIAKTKRIRDKHTGAKPKGRGFRGWRNFRGDIVWKTD
jgi:5-methylcytosine-specific restriction protein A